ncbi:MAG: zinc ribbon domain-containing protein [Pyrinomonadaceae bacterium]
MRSKFELTRCSACGKQIHKDAKFCPYCDVERDV